ncbi:phosphatase PAP2 family protein [Glycomyces buryatensis]|nr:phosphatase PAP2 family protein [Glycomyces buryatensis]
MGTWSPFLVKRPGSWGLEIAMALALVLWTIPLAWVSPLIDIDIWIRDFADANRPDWFDFLLVQTNKFGQGGLLGGIALGIAGIISYRRRTVRPLLAFLALYAMAGSVLVLKDVLPRVYPHWPGPAHPPYADATQSLLFTTLEPAGAYPSGHVLNTIVWYGFLVFLLGGHLKTWQRRLIRTFPPIIVAFSTTYLGFHWFTDCPAGLFIGVIILRVIQRIRWDTIELPSWLEPEKRYL